jgi:hypothetical protein
MGIIHAFNNPKADGPDDTIVRPSNWNEAHAVTFFKETPSGAINGVNLVFTLTQTPITDSLDLYLNGLLLWEGDDYTLSTNQITMIEAPIGGADPDVLRAKYL